MSDQEVVFRDFSRQRKRVVFGLDGQRFECLSALGTEELQDLMRMYRGGNLQEMLKGNDAEQIMMFVRNMFKIFLLEESFPAFINKLKDKKNPVDVFQLLDIIRWVVETYTNRPTQPSLNSSEESPSGDGGTSSTAGAQLEESLLSNLISVAS